jgi:hypothetical protein
MTFRIYKFKNLKKVKIKLSHRCDRTFNVPYKKVYEKKKVIKKGSTIIWNYAENLINESVNKGILKK